MNRSSRSGPGLNRRSFISGSAAVAMGGCSSIGPSRVGNRPLGLADITVMRELTQDYAGTLRKAGALGYSHFGFRLAGYDPRIAEIDPREKARMVRDAGLEVGVVRLSPRGTNYDREIDLAAATGASIVALSTAPVFIAARPFGVISYKKFDAWLPDLARLGEKCRKAGLTFAFHNHPWDLRPFPDAPHTPMDRILEAVPAENLSFELDLAWCWLAGVEPLSLLRRLGTRVVSMHLKDVDRTRGVEHADVAVTIGQGEMHWEQLLPQIDRLSNAIGFIEVDAPADGLAAASDGMTFVRRARGERPFKS